jgi:hypothetical protein
MPVPNCPIPTPYRHLRRRLAVFLLFLAAIPVFAAKPEPPLRIPLENLGFQPQSTQFLLNGSSMLTLHYVDEKHLLVTFVVHRLIPRLPDEPEDDQDRVVDAVLLEISTGRVLARTTWHLHDHAQYLWNLGHGHFLLRVRDALTTFAPLANLATKDPFAQQPFIVSAERRLAALILSPDADLLIIETVKRVPHTAKPKTPLFGPTPEPTPGLKERNAVQINFYRLHAGDDGGPVLAHPAGAIQTPSTGDIPATTAGFLAVVDQGHQHWAFDFHTYSGKKAELSPFDSSCSPAPVFVSHSEFIAFGCRGGQSRQQLGGFNMRGEEMWEQGLFGDFVAPSIAYAPSAGRFALSRILLRISAVPDQPISSDEVSAQAVVVYQTGTGKQLLRADCSPVSRAGQNFALSPNGLALAVVHADAIEIYSLPPLTTKDESDLKLARSIAPPESDLPVSLPGRSSPNDADPDPSPDLQTAAAPASVTNSPPDSTQPTSSNPPATASHPHPATSHTGSSEAPAPSAPPTSSSSADTSPAPASPSSADTSPPPASPSSGDTPPEQRRSAPTIYTLPGDKTPATPQEKPQNASPQ